MTPYKLSEELLEITEDIKTNLDSEKYLTLCNLASELHKIEDEQIMYFRIFYPNLYPPGSTLDDTQALPLCNIRQITLQVRKSEIDSQDWEDVKTRMEARNQTTTITFCDLIALLPTYQGVHLIEQVFGEDEVLISEQSEMLLQIQNHF